MLLAFKVFKDLRGRKALEVDKVFKEDRVSKDLRVLRDQLV